MAKKVSVMALLAAVNRGLRKKRMSSIGVGVCSSQTMNDAIATAPTANEPSTSGSVQPFAGPSMMPKSSEPRPTIESTAPSGSRCEWLGSFEVGTRNHPATSASATSGRLTQNTELHSKWRSSSPPVTGPMATARPEKPAHTAIARPRSRGSRKTLVRIDSVAGMISAPPMPMKARLAMSWTVDVDSAADTEPMANTTRPICSAPLRPNRSLRLPVVSRRPAKTRV